MAQSDSPNPAAPQDDDSDDAGVAQTDATPAGADGDEDDAAPAAPQAGSGLIKGASKGVNKLHPDNVMRSLKIPPDMMHPFTAAVKSCIHFCVGEQSQQLFLNALKGPGPISQKIADGTMHLLTIVMKQAGGQFPPQLFVPVGVYFISWAADYINKLGVAKVADKDIGMATQMFIQDVLNASANAKKRQGLVGGAQQPQQPGGPQQGGQPPGGQPMPQPGPAMAKMPPPPAASAPGAQPQLGPGAAPQPRQ